MRVVNEAHLICGKSKDGIPVHIHAGNTDCEAYSINIGTDAVNISSAGANGAFYALQTLKQLLAENDGIVFCQSITDAPDMKYRGFYHDVTRGKIPTLETLKELVDTMAGYKMNSLQLYIEHTFEFKEYEFCREKLGYLTKDEIRELDKYCKSKFVELIPSVASFGHLYHLLMSEKYKHLSELPDYVPTTHYWMERMCHHTINPELEESFEVIKSLLDQFMEVTTSDKFNICCDETSDLGEGVNKGKDKAKLYIGFVQKILKYLTSKGKTVMMWGDIILQHPECIDEIPPNVIVLNWGYEKNPAEEQYRKLYESGRKQILCPATSAWLGFSDDVQIEEGNIMTLASYAYKFGAEGMLITNWGDFGHLSSITMSLYGLILGAAVSWNKETTACKKFRQEVSMRVFGNTEMVDLNEKISEIKPILNWSKAVICGKEYKYFELEDYQAAVKTLHEIKAHVEKLEFYSDIVRREAIAAIEGYLLIAQICAKIDGHKEIRSGINCKEWCEEYTRLWLERNKHGELDEVIHVINERLS